MFYQYYKLELTENLSLFYEHIVHIYLSISRYSILTLSSIGPLYFSFNMSITIYKL